MTQPVEKTSSARHRENEHDEPPAKHQKLDIEVVLPTRITDLNENCLTKIFTHLNLTDLLNVAMSNKKLQLAAATTFGIEFGMKSIWLQNAINFSPPRIDMLDHDDICVRGLKFCLPFLRCFGASISELFIFDGTYPHVLMLKRLKNRFSFHVDRYLNQYCAENVTNLLFYGRPAFSWENFRKQFLMVRKIRLIDTDLENGSHFAKWFPNLCHFEMDTVCIDTPFAIEPLPLLEHLTLKINTTTSNNLWNFNEQNAMNFLQSTAVNLKSLEIDMPDRQSMTIQKLLDLINRNANISKLMMSDGSRFEDVTMDELEQLVRNRPWIEQIDLPRHKFTAENIIFCIGHLKNLKKMRFHMSDWSEYHQLLQQIDCKWQLKLSHQTIELTLTTQ